MSNIKPLMWLSKTCKATKYDSKFPNEHLQSDSQTLYCTACEKSIAIKQRFQVNIISINAIYKLNIKRTKIESWNSNKVFFH